MPLFFGSNSTKALTAKQAREKFEKWKRFSGIRKNLTIHSFRSGYATILYRATGDILLVAQAMGHADIRTTQRYIADDASRIHDIIRKAFAQNTTDDIC
jgi:site-specific recombinase XerD